MVGRKEPFRIEYPLLGCVRSLFLTRYLPINTVPQDDTKPAWTDR